MDGCERTISSSSAMPVVGGALNETGFPMAVGTNEFTIVGFGSRTDLSG